MIWEGDFTPGSYGAEMQRIERELKELLPEGDPKREELLALLQTARDDSYKRLLSVGQFIAEHGAEAFLRGEYSSDG